MINPNWNYRLKKWKTTKQDILEISSHQRILQKNPKVNLCIKDDEDNKIAMSEDKQIKIVQKSTQRNEKNEATFCKGIDLLQRL